MYFNTIFRLLPMAFSIHLGINHAYADYFMAHVAPFDVNLLTLKRFEVAKDYMPEVLNEEAKLDKPTVIDWSDAKSSFRAVFHMTLKEFDPSQDLDTTLKPHLATAITKVKFKVTGVEFMKKFMALELDSKPVLKDKSIKLTKEEKSALKHFSVKTPHVSLFKIMSNDDEDIKGYTNAWKIETKKEQETKIWDEMVKNINKEIGKIKFTSSDFLEEAVENIKNLFFSAVEKTKSTDKAAETFADMFFTKFEKYYKNTLKIKRSNLINSDEELMEAYIKTVFFGMSPKTVKVNEEKSDDHQYKVVVDSPLDTDNLKDIIVDNRSRGDAKNNFKLLKSIIDLMGLKEMKEFVGYTYKTSKVPELTNWLFIKEELEKVLKGSYISFSGVESIAKTEKVDMEEIDTL